MNVSELFFFLVQVRSIYYAEAWNDLIKIHKASEQFKVSFFFKRESLLLLYFFACITHARTWSQESSNDFSYTWAGMKVKSILFQIYKIRWSASAKLFHLMTDLIEMNHCFLTIDLIGRLLAIPSKIESTKTKIIATLVFLTRVNGLNNLKNKKFFLLLSYFPYIHLLWIVPQFNVRYFNVCSIFFDREQSVGKADFYVLLIINRILFFFELYSCDVV